MFIRLRLFSSSCDMSFKFMFTVSNVRIWWSQGWGHMKTVSNLWSSQSPLIACKLIPHLAYISVTLFFKFHQLYRPLYFYIQFGFNLSISVSNIDCNYFIFYLAAQHSLWDLCSLAGDWAQDVSNESPKSLALQGIPSWDYFIFIDQQEKVFMLTMCWFF